MEREFHCPHTHIPSHIPHGIGPFLHLECAHDTTLTLKRRADDCGFCEQGQQGITSIPFDDSHILMGHKMGQQVCNMCTHTLRTVSLTARTMSAAWNAREYLLLQLQEPESKYRNPFLNSPGWETWIPLLPQETESKFGT